MTQKRSRGFAPNIDNKGRLLRASGAVAIGGAAIMLWSQSVVASTGLALAATFLAYEAARGWCPLRARGIRTKF